MTKNQTQLRDFSREELASIGYDLVPSNIPAAKFYLILHLHADKEPGDT